MDKITRYGAIITTTVSIFAGAAPAMAQPAPYGKGDAMTAATVAKGMRPVPYERGKVSPAKVGKLAHRMIPRPGSDNSNRLCSSPSKARRIACR
jgi:hypothetical protein